MLACHDSNEAQRENALLFVATALLHVCDGARSWDQTSTSEAANS